MVQWTDYIVAEKAILGGKPIIKGTRLSVEFILERLAAGWTEQKILDNYPKLTKAAMQAVFAYAYDCMKDGLLFANDMNKAS